MKTETITCECGTAFEWTPDPDEWIASLTRPRSCPECSERIQTEEREQRQLENEKRQADYVENIRREVASATPAIFKATDTSHARFNVAGWQRAKFERNS